MSYLMSEAVVVAVVPGLVVVVPDGLAVVVVVGVVVQLAIRPSSNKQATTMLMILLFIPNLLK